MRNDFKMVMKQFAMLLLIFVFLAATLVSCREEKETNADFVKVELSKPNVIKSSYNWVEVSSFIDIFGTETNKIRDIGFCWSVKPGVDLNDSILSIGTNLNKDYFNYNLSGLSANAVYYMRAYTITNSEIFYSQEISFRTKKYTTPIISDGTIKYIEAQNVKFRNEVIDDGGQQIISRGVCWSELPYPTLNNSFTIDGSDVGVYFSVIGNLVPSTTYYFCTYATNSIGTTYGKYHEITTDFCGIKFDVQHTEGSVSPESKSIEYNTVRTNLGGKNQCWIIQNLGAEVPANDFNDVSENSAGWYWQFNKMQGYKHDGSQRLPNTTWIYPISESSDWLPENDPCSLTLGSGWRIPSSTELIRVYLNGGFDDGAEAFSSILKLHFAGYLNYADGKLLNRGTIGYYWSNSQSNLEFGGRLFFNENSVLFNNNIKANAHSIRCVKD